ncbi:type I restriction enzyme HsdR N-terminal domain-containing protein [uncultured Roseivirga sp.]|uniref:type I restriction enzyme HsdR N-terminal domain-containing protein n=1 Tax=uncultured Roseivirga sp. TaxID=543088 RepID=UPI0030D8DA35|tara:strand:- start:138735 stop:139196 length:462 start_codon:yes stop_codon:yes gene_type:complete
MDSLNLPAYKYRLEKRDGKLVIFDPIRKKFVVLTPEEWVRQHFIHFLSGSLGYSLNRMSVETGNKYNQLQKRSDILFYDEHMKPLVIVECKAPSIKITQNAFDQIAVYNKTLKAKLLVVTNGMAHYACWFDAENEKVNFLDQIPNLQELKAMI